MAKKPQKASPAKKSAPAKKASGAKQASAAKKKQPAKKKASTKSPKKKAAATKKKAAAAAATYDAKRHAPLEIKTHRALAGNMRAISQRFNENPDIARMILVNPILALEELGVTLSPEMKEHAMNALRFPPSVVERTAKLEAELNEELSQLGVNFKLPLAADQRADVLFRTLEIAPRETDEAPAQISPKDTRAYADQHPLVAKLAEYERLRQGRMIFYTREAYRAYKAGLKRQNWIKSVKFKI
jgi:hypothetical protein